MFLPNQCPFGLSISLKMVYLEPKISCHLNVRTVSKSILGSYDPPVHIASEILYKLFGLFRKFKVYMDRVLIVLRINITAFVNFEFTRL